MPPLMSAPAAVSRACSLLPAILGITSAARMPMMATTSMISTSVNPRLSAWRSLVFGTLLFLVSIFINNFLFDVLAHRKHRQQHADEDEADESGDEEKQ